MQAVNGSIHLFPLNNWVNIQCLGTWRKRVSSVKPSGKAIFGGKSTIPLELISNGPLNPLILPARLGIYNDFSILFFLCESF